MNRVWIEAHNILACFLDHDARLESSGRVLRACAFARDRKRTRVGMG